MKQLWRLEPIPHTPSPCQGRAGRGEARTRDSSWFFPRTQPFLRAFCSGALSPPWFPSAPQGRGLFTEVLNDPMSKLQVEYVE
jgi:hypothetical protein